MAKILNTVPIVLERDDDGNPLKERKLCYTLKALAAFEDKYNKSIAEVFSPTRDEHGQVMTDENGQPLNMSFRFGMLIDLIWVGLLRDDPTITPDIVGDNLTSEDMIEVLPLILNAISASNVTRFPEASVQKDKKAKPKN